MKIDVGDFGYKTPGEVAGPNVPAQAFVTQGVPELGQAGLKIGHEAAQSAEQDAQLAYSEQHRKTLEAQAEAKLVARDAKRAEARTIHAKGQNDLVAAHDQIANGVKDGTISVDAAPKLWADASAKIVDQHLKTVDKANAGLVKSSLEVNVGALGHSINQSIVAQNRHTIGASLNDTLEEYQRLGMTDLATAKRQGTMVIEAQGPLAGYNAEQVSKMKHAFVEGATYNAVNSGLTKIQNDPKALNEFIKSLPNMPDLDPGKRNILETKALNFQVRNEARGARAEASRLATLQHQVGAVDSMMLKGYEPDAATLASLQTAAKGTPYEATVAQQIAFSKQTAAFRVAPPIEQEKFVNQMEAQVRANPTPQGIQTLDRYKSINRAQDEEIKKDPYSYGARNGLGAPPPLDFSNPMTIGDQIAARVPFARGMKEQYRAPMKLISEQEAQLLADSLKGLQPGQKAAQLQALTRNIGDAEAVREMAGQLAPNDKDLSTGMLLAARDMNAGNGRTVAELYFKGQQAIKDKTAKIDEKAEFGIRAELAKKLDGVYATPEGSHAALEAGLHVYAGLKSEGTDDVGRALQMVTGGVVDHNGGKIALPYSYGGKGWFDSRFADAVAKITADDLKRMGGGDEFRVGKTTLKAEDLVKQLPGARLQTVGDGIYTIQSDAGYVRLPNGKPLYLDMTQPFVGPVAPKPALPAMANDELVVARDKTVDRDRKKKR